jgi:hypothetical protein
MWKAVVITLTVVNGFAIAFVSSCNKPSFTGEEKKPDPQNHIVQIAGVDNLDNAGEKRVKSYDSVDFQITTKAAKIENSLETTMYPVDLYFVVDRTFSMDGELAEVKRGLVEIASGLKSKGVDLQAGFIGFVDDPAIETQNPFAKLTGDMNELARYIETVTPMSNEDYPEMSLAAISKAIDRFIAGDGRPNAAKMIMLVSDVVGHNGGPIANETAANRDCSLTALTTKVNNFATSLGDPARFKFFYVVPDPRYIDSNSTGDLTNANTQCPDAPGSTTRFNAKQQMEAFMNGILPTLSPDKRGGALLDSTGKIAWPLRNNNLVTSLIPMIAASKPLQKSLSCVATKVEALDGARVLYSWESPGIQAMMTDTNQYITLNDVLRQEQKRGLGAQQVQLKINRCCVETTINSQSNTGLSCQKEYVQTINYRIINE